MRIKVAEIQESMTLDEAMDELVSKKILVSVKGSDGTTYCARYHSNKTTLEKIAAKKEA